MPGRIPCLVTANTAEFRRVQDLSVENWIA
jgi:predicted nucleic acid-binding protein